MPEFPQHSFLHGVYSLCGSRYNNTLFLDHLEEEEKGLYTFYALNSEANSSVTFSVSVKGKCLALLLPKGCLPRGCCPTGRVQGLWTRALPAQCPQDADVLLLGPSSILCIAQGFLKFCCSVDGE